MLWWDIINDLEETKKTIKNNWLYTGDVAKTDKDGFIYLVARKKEIIKVGGKRVSPKEIEEVILTVSDVVDCTINAVYDDILGESIKATVVIEGKFSKIELTERILKKCKENLSLFKIPQLIVFKNTMDVKPTGKKMKKFL